MFCSKCGKEVNTSDSFCSSCGNLVDKNNHVEQDYDFSKRVLCSDGSCIGVIGEDGLCKVCKKNYEEDSDVNDFDEKAENFERQRLKVNKIGQKKSSRNLLLVFVAAIVILGYFGTTNKSPSLSSSSPTVTSPKTAAELRKERIEQGFSAWDGSHRELEKLIKKTMNDPDSYDHEETVYTDKGDHLIVKTTFRGKNSFGGVVKNWVVVKADLDGNIIEVVSQGP